MKFTAAIAAAILGAATTLAVPLQQSTSNTLVPTVISKYNVWTGAIFFNTGLGRIYKDGRNPEETTLVTFKFPDTLKGKQCKFVFTLDANQHFSGSAKFDIYTSLAPATASSSTWPSGNLRDQYLGRFQALVGDATPIDHANNPFPCPAGQTLGAELVGVFDNDEIFWDVNAPGIGPKIVVL